MQEELNQNLYLKFKINKEVTVDLLREAGIKEAIVFSMTFSKEQSKESAEVLRQINPLFLDKNCRKVLLRAIKNEAGTPASSFCLRDLDCAKLFLDDKFYSGTDACKFCAHNLECFTQNTTKYFVINETEKGESENV